MWPVTGQADNFDLQFRARLALLCKFRPFSGMDRLGLACAHEFAQIAAMQHEELAQTTMPERLPSLTGIRGVAAVWVVMYHMIQLSWHFDLPLKLPGHAVAMSGWAGVDLFFLLSGFMLMHVHAGECERLSWPVCKEFALSRFFRVYPLSAAALLCVLCLILSDSSFADWYRQRRPGMLSTEAFFATLGLVTIWYRQPGEWNGPVWSLSAELVGYLFFPLIAWLCIRLRSFWACFALAGLCIASVLIQQYNFAVVGGNNLGTGSGLTRMAGFFTAGILIRRARQIRTSNRGLPLLAGLSVVACVVLLWVPHGGGFMPIAFAGLIYGLSDQRGPVSWLLSTRIAVFLGAISFPLYLLHTMPLYAYDFHMARGDLPRWFYNPGLVLFLIGMCGVSWLAHKGIEQPCHRYARSLIRRARPA